MFNWSVLDEPVIVKLPFEIYWGITGSVTIILAIGLSFMNPPACLHKIVDKMPFGGLKGYLKNTEMYRASKESSDEKRKKEEKRRAKDENTIDV
jgi:hypothetical protein